MDFKDLTDKLGFVRFDWKSVFDVFKELAFPKLFIVLHKCQEKLKKCFSNEKPLKLRILNFHHFKHVGILRIFKVFFYLIWIINFEFLKFFRELFVHFLWQRGQIFIVHYFTWVQQNYHYLNTKLFTSDSIDKSINWAVVTPAKNGIGAVRYSFIINGTIGIIMFYHLKGKSKDVNA